MSLSAVLQSSQDPSRGCVGVMWGHRASVVGVAFAPSGTQAVSMDDSGFILAWALPEGRVRWSAEVVGSVRDLQLSPSGRYVAIGYCASRSDGDEAIPEATTRVAVYELETGAACCDVSIATNPDCRQWGGGILVRIHWISSELAYCYSEFETESSISTGILDVARGTLDHVGGGPLIEARDGRFAVVGRSPQGARVFIVDASTMESVWKSEPVLQVLPSDRGVLAIASDQEDGADRSVRLVAMGDGQVLGRWPLESKSKLVGVLCDWNGPRILTAGSELLGERVLDVQAGQWIGASAAFGALGPQLVQPTKERAFDRSDTQWHFREHFGLLGTPGPWARLALVAYGHQRPVELLGHDGEVCATAFHPSGLLLSAGEDGSVRLWSLEQILALREGGDEEPARHEEDEAEMSEDAGGLAGVPSGGGDAGDGHLEHQTPAVNLVDHLQESLLAASDDDMLVEDEGCQSPLIPSEGQAITALPQDLPEFSTDVRQLLPLPNGEVLVVGGRELCVLATRGSSRGQWRAVEPGVHGYSRAGEDELLTTEHLVSHPATGTRLFKWCAVDGILSMEGLLRGGGWCGSVELDKYFEDDRAAQDEDWDFFRRKPGLRGAVMQARSRPRVMVNWIPSSSDAEPVTLVWDLDELCLEARHTGRRCLALSPNGNWALDVIDGSPLVWSPDTGECELVFDWLEGARPNFKQYAITDDKEVIVFGESGLRIFAPDGSSEDISPSRESARLGAGADPVNLLIHTTGPSNPRHGHIVHVFDLRQRAYLGEWEGSAAVTAAFVTEDCDLVVGDAAGRVHVLSFQERARPLA